MIASDRDLMTASTARQVDGLLREVIEALEIELPARIRAYYLVGSYIDGSERRYSDLDLCLVARDMLSKREQERVSAIQVSYSLAMPVVLDIAVLDEGLLLTTGHFRIKYASQFLRGDDIRGQMPDMSVHSYLHYYSIAPASYFTQVLRHVEHVAFPLSYPNPAGEFYRYDQPYLPPTSKAQPNIKGLISAACWAATILVGWKAGKIVPTKSASVSMYKEFLRDDWAPFLVELYEWGSTRWHYRIPERPDERLRLRHLCGQMLAFENHYLLYYRTYLLAELRGDTECIQNALPQLEVIRFADDELRTAALPSLTQMTHRSG